MEMENTSQPKKEITINRVFDAPVDAVWKAWTDEKLVQQWWGPRGVFNPVCEVDARKGGKLNIVMEAGKELGPYAGQKWPMSGEFEEVTPKSRLVFSSKAIDDVQKAFIETEVTVEFEELNDKTKMKMHMVVTKIDTANLRTQGALQGMEQGWNQQVDKLGEFLEKK